MTPDTPTAEDAEDLLRLAEDEIVRLRKYGSPAERAEGAARLVRGEFVAPAGGRQRTTS